MRLENGLCPDCGRPAGEIFISKKPGESFSDVKLWIRRCLHCNFGAELLEPATTLEPKAYIEALHEEAPRIAALVIPALIRGYQRSAVPRATGSSGV